MAERRSAARSRRRGWRGRSWPARALPPTEPLSVITYWYERKTADADLKQLLEAQPGGVAVLRFTVAGRYAIPHIIDSRRGGPWKVQVDQIPELNTHLKGSLVAANPREPARFTGVCSGCAPCKGGALQWVQIPPGNRSSRKQPEQLWR